MNRWIQQLFSDRGIDENEPLRVQLFRFMCLTTGVMCLGVVFPLGWIQKLPLWVHVATFLLGCWGLLCFWLSRRGRHWFWGFYVVLVGLLNSVWFLNAGSEGSIPYFFFPAMVYPLTIFRGKTRWITAGLLVVNVWVLLGLEYWYPSLLIPFERPVDRLVDLISGMFAGLLTLALVVWLILRSYEREQARLDRALAELSASEQRYREIFNSTSDALFIYGTDGALLDMNNRACALFGYERAEFAKLTMGEMSLGISPYAEKDSLVKVGRTLKEGSQTFRWRNRCKNGHLFWSEVALRAADIAGQPRIIASVRDITERVANEEALRKNEERLRLALSASQQGWFEMNVQTGQGIVSEEYLKLIGYDSGDFVITQQGWLEAIHPEDLELVMREYRACIAEGIPRALEYRRRTKTGDWIWIRSIGQIVERDADGKPLRMIGTHTDITDRKQLETQLLHSQRLETIGTLAAGVAHDLNNILTPMLMVPSVLEDKLGDPKDRELLDQISKGAKRGAAIVRQLLTFSRDLAQSRLRVDLLPVIKETRDIIRATFPPDIKFVMEVAADLKPVAADAIQIHQVFMNLCINARDAMPAGGIITLTAENLKRPGAKLSRNPWNLGADNISITVADTGHGIPPEIKDRIFDPFFTTKDVGHGTGLGLSTVFGIVKAHGGSITVESSPNQGARFKIVLPAIAA